MDGPALLEPDVHLQPVGGGELESIAAHFASSHHATGAICAGLKELSSRPRECGKHETVFFRFCTSFLIAWRFCRWDDVRAPLWIPGEHGPIYGLRNKCEALGLKDE